MKKLSICIPTYNRSYHLKNCLNSILLNGNEIKNVEVCISDNNSTDDTKKIVNFYKQYIDINYHTNSENIGVAKNILKAVEISNSDFCWVIGDDDMLLKNSVKEVLNLIKRHEKVDYFYVNSYHFDSKLLKNYSYPINTNELPNNLEKFSSFDSDFKTKFIELINPEISFDFLGGLYLSVFRKYNWDKNLNKLNQKNLNNNLLFSNIDNTYPHIKIFSYAFKNSDAYFCSKALSINLFGVREWTSLYPIVRSIRSVDALNVYYKNGLPFIKLLKYKNYALQYFLPDVLKLLINIKNSYPYLIEILFFYLKNCYYPKLYLSIFYQLGRSIKKYFK